MQRYYRLSIRIIRLHTQSIINTRTYPFNEVIVSGSKIEEHRMRETVYES